MKKFSDILAQYESQHQNKTNRRFHSIGVPLVMFSVLGGLNLIPTPDLHVPEALESFAAPGTLASVLGSLIILRYSLRAGAALLATALLMSAGALILIEQAGRGVAAAIIAAAFVIGWGFQFAGHAAEKKPPAFVKEPLSLLLGPVMVLNMLAPLVDAPKVRRLDNAEI